MIIRISDARQRGIAGSEGWWAAARASAIRGEAPHGIHQLMLEPHVTHVDVFVTEVGEVWRWAERFDGWLHEGRKQLFSEPLASTESNAIHVSDDSLREFRKHRAD